MTISISQPVRGVIFDLDGTLYKMRWFMRPLFFLHFFPHGMRLPHYMEARETLGGRDFGSKELLASALAAAFADREHVSVEAARVWIFDTFYDSFVSIMHYMKGTRPGLLPILSALKSKGVKLAVLSDFSRIPERLEKLDIPAALFDTVSSCEDWGALKPHPRSFMQIVKEWMLPPSQLLVIGDREDTDGEAARTCGIQFLRITDTALQPGKAAKTWKELSDFLLSI